MPRTRVSASFVDGQGSSWSHQGAWDGDADYSPDDVVTHEGSSYVALLSNTSTQPDADPDVWGLVAAAGSGGSAGPSNIIAESSGPTNLTVGAWLEGQVLQRSGSTAIGVYLTVSLSVFAFDAQAFDLSAMDVISTVTQA